MSTLRLIHRHTCMLFESNKISGHQLMHLKYVVYLILTNISSPIPICELSKQLCEEHWYLTWA